MKIKERKRDDTKIKVNLSEERMCKKKKKTEGRLLKKKKRKYCRSKEIIEKNNRKK